MNPTETAMANAINAYRTMNGLSSLTLSNGVAEGVAQWHATDMNNNNYVGQVGSDGESVSQRLACSGVVVGPNNSVTASGQNNSVMATFAQLTNLPFGQNGLDNPGLSQLAVGYDNGFWMIIAF